MLIAVSLFDLLPEGLELPRAGVAVRGKGNRSMAHEEDVNEDGWVDLVVQVETENLDPTKCQDGHAVVNGEIFDEKQIEDKDEITIVPPE